MNPMQTASPSSNTDIVLYASSRLSLREVPVSAAVPDLFREGAEEFRRLTPEWYAWLRSRMERARAACASGVLSPASWEFLRARFNELHGRALGEHGGKALRRAVAGFSEPQKATALPEGATSPGGRSGASRPSPHLCPAAGSFRFTQPVAPEALAMVDAIRERALALGWTHNLLYQNRGNFKFPCGPEWGLIGLLHPGSRIGEVTRGYIEIINPGPSRSTNRFHNMEASQPWLKRTTRP